MCIKVASATLAFVFALVGCSERSTTAGREAGGCGQAEAASALLDARELVRSNTPVYWTDDRGRLLVGGFDGRTPRLLHQWPRHEKPEVFVSPDRRWMLYELRLEGKPTRRQLWLFDTRSEGMIKVFDEPAHWLGLPAFSPDGRSVAFFNQYDHSWPAAQGMGLYVIDTERGQTDFIGSVEGSAISPMKMQAAAEWSVNGDSVLLTVGGGDVSEYHAFSPATRKFRRIQGRYNAEVRETEFSENGVKVPMLKQAMPRGREMYYELASPDGSSMARVNDKYELVVAVPGGKNIRIDVGQYSMCEGITMAIVAWLEQDKYLVYWAGGSDYYIAEPATGRKAKMIVPGAVAMDATW